MRLRCACGGELPPYPGVGRPRSTCDACKRRQRKAIDRRQWESGKALAGERRRRAADRALANRRQREKWARLRAEIIEAYGGRCACCGEDQPEFLTLDHVEGGGAAERKKHGPRHHLLAAKREGFPPRFQVLCWNCNCARQYNGGVCPHEREVAATLGLVA